MTTAIRGTSDDALRLFQEALRSYEERRPRAKIEMYRHNSISIRIRVIDPAFARLEKSDRHATIWKHLETLPEEIQTDVSMLVLLTPGEVKTSMANLEFENPSPSLIK